MPRLARLVLPDVALHVIQRGHDRSACFRDDTDRLVYLVLLRDCLKKSHCLLHTYCLMTNHIHMLLTPPHAVACAVLMRNLGQRYVQYFNRRYARTGTLWDGRPRSCLVDSARYVLACYRYIERNPVRAGIVEEPAAYQWSSHQANIGRIDDSLLTPHAEYGAPGNDLDSRRRAYDRLFDTSDDADFVREIRDATNGGFPLLSEDVKLRLSSDAKRHLERRKPGPRAGDTSAERVLSLDLPL